MDTEQPQTVETTAKGPGRYIVLAALIVAVAVLFGPYIRGYIDNTVEDHREEARVRASIDSLVADFDREFPSRSEP